MAYLPARITDNLYLNLDTGCWEWRGYTEQNGYGRCRFHGLKYLVHRLMYELVRGRVDKRPGHDHLMHLCENKACCNPWHLRPGTNSENQLHYHKMRRRQR